MTNKNMVLCIYLVMGFLLYNLYFDIAWPFSPHNHIVEVVMAIPRVYLVFAVISLTFPGLSKLPCALYVPLKAPKSLEKQLIHSPELSSKNQGCGKTVGVLFIVLVFYSLESKANSKLQPVNYHYLTTKLNLTTSKQFSIIIISLHQQMSN